MDSHCNLDSLFGVLSLLDQLERTGKASETTTVGTLIKHGLRDTESCSEAIWDTIAVTRRSLSDHATLQDYRFVLRSTINIKSRPAVQGSHIMRLPGEILTDVCRYLYPLAFLDSDRFATISMMDNFVQPNKAIQSLRLTCRRLRDASTPFLLTFPRVDLREASLAKFEELSRHPTIGPSIRGVQVTLHYFDPRMAADECVFSKYSMGKLYNSAGSLWSAGVFDAKSSESGLYEEENSLDGSQTRDHWLKITKEAYPEYVRLYQDQQRLREDGSFVRRVSAALAKLKGMKRLEVNDGSLGRGRFDPYSEDKGSKEDLMRVLLSPRVWEQPLLDSLPYQLDQLARANLEPTEVLFSLLQSVGDAWNWIDNFCIDITPMHDYTLLTTTTQERKDITCSVQKLKTFQFKSNRCSDLWPYDESVGPEVIIQLLTALVDIPGLQRLILEMPPVWGDPSNMNTESYSFGPILTSRTWPQLESVYISDMTLHNAEYEAFLLHLNRRNGGPSLRFKSLEIIYPDGYWEDH
ncbi:hypothetical protein BKA67DRAFT_557735 [Truncatella angustata]|uniref:F-box domain-containing protein n=1 Tax=Truncatella angustata TaxID=152316 RepID=A0A9P9A0G2_9PEZI|nr:uncharacterized protein BKA67DRAFT_557735 [Truncatella angustata]KAH6658337.1 hypothetical protein BKA67DRAFT_557735 [Truncatella angustata]